MLLVVFGKKILVYEYGLIFNKENILAPGAIISNKPLDNNKKTTKNTIKPLLACFSLEF
jgi:hypothetical protein